MIRLGIVFGGRSGEHELSLMSAASVIRALNNEKYIPVCIGITKEGNWLRYDGPVDQIEDGSWQEAAEKALAEDPDQYTFTVLGPSGRSLKELIDFALPVLHGSFGEDGSIQGLFEMADIPYGGCGVLGSAAAMDKALAKEIFANQELPICRHQYLFREEILENMEKVMDRVEKYLPYPIFVKPANMGSSEGISKAENSAELKAALLKAIRYDRRLVLEEGLDCRQIQTGILGNYDTKATAVGELLSSGEFCGSQAKYFDAEQAKICIPAEIPADIADEIRSAAIEAYQILDCCGYARVDFFLEKGTNKVYLNGINTIPGLEKSSMFPLLWAEAGISYPELIDRIVELGFERYAEKRGRE